MTYRVVLVHHNLPQTLAARNLETIAEAAEAAFRLTALQYELGGAGDYVVEPE
jgi:hypothetical protein